MKRITVVTAFLLLFPVAGCAAPKEEIDIPVMRIATDKENIDVYIRNLGSDGKEFQITDGLIYTNLGGRLNFRFFEDGRECVECSVTAKENMPHGIYEVPEFDFEINSIHGVSFPAWWIREQYNLKPTCYTFFAEAAGAITYIKGGPHIPLKLVSNIVHMCFPIKGDGG